VRAEGDCLLVDGGDLAVVEHLKEAKDAEVGEGAVPPAVRRLGRAGYAGSVDHVYWECSNKGEEGPAEDDKKDDPERSLGELLVGRECSTWVLAWLCVSRSCVAHILDSIIGRIRGDKGNGRVEKGEKAVGERTRAEGRCREPLAESVEGAGAWSDYGEGGL